MHRKNRWYYVCVCVCGGGVMQYEYKLFYPVTGRNEHACMLLIYLLVELYELQER